MAFPGERGPGKGRLQDRSAVPASAGPDPLAPVPSPASAAPMVGVGAGRWRRPSLETGRRHPRPFIARRRARRRLCAGLHQGQGGQRQSSENDRPPVRHQQPQISQMPRGLPGRAGPFTTKRNTGFVGGGMICHSPRAKSLIQRNPSWQSMSSVLAQDGTNNLLKGQVADLWVAKRALASCPCCDAPVSIQIA